MTHTPGPWKIETSADRTPAVCVTVPASEGTGFAVAIVNRIRPMTSVRGDMDANARLIAAAPEMLEALEAVVASFVLWRVGGKEMEQARAAIAKAKGD